MKGDFTRNTFDATKHFTRVLMQQGRVQLDADWNEQVSILLHYLQSLAKDLIGPDGGPINHCGFEIVIDQGQLSDEEKQQLAKSGLQLDLPDFFIATGHYYVDGLLCESETVFTYKRQPDYPGPESLETGKIYLVYLDAWERHLTAIEDRAIREVALGWPDTATRAKVVCQVKTAEVMDPDEANCEAVRDRWATWVEKWQPKNQGMLKAKAREPKGAEATDPCITPPQARYRGLENQLYRVEIHRGGTGDQATFKWSRDNGSVVFPIRKLTGNLATLEHLGRDSRFGLAVGDWVEIVDDNYVLRGGYRPDDPRPLVQVDKVDHVEMMVTLNIPSGLNIPYYTEDDPLHPLLRRWDHREGDPTLGGLKLENDNALPVQEDKWITLEDGVQIYFEPAKPPGEQHQYRSGDYWLIPARTATGDVEWPIAKDNKGNPIPVALPPHGVEHHYAPLAVISVDSGERSIRVEDCRCTFNRLACPEIYYSAFGSRAIGADLL